MRTSFGVVMRIVIELSCWPDTKSRVFQQPASSRRAPSRARARSRPASARSRRQRGACRTPSRRAARRWKADRKSTRLNSSHEWISYAVFCLKKKIKYDDHVKKGKGLAVINTDQISAQLAQATAAQNASRAEGAAEEARITERIKKRDTRV